MAKFSIRKWRKQKYQEFHLNAGKPIAWLSIPRLFGPAITDAQAEKLKDEFRANQQRFAARKVRAA